MRSVVLNYLLVGRCAYIVYVKVTVGLLLFWWAKNPIFCRPTLDDISYKNVGNPPKIPKNPQRLRKFPQNPGKLARKKLGVKSETETETLADAGDW
jgi:hypothetical protein